MVFNLLVILVEGKNKKMIHHLQSEVKILLASCIELLTVVRDQYSAHADQCCGIQIYCSATMEDVIPAHKGR